MPPKPKRPPSRTPSAREADRQAHLAEEERKRLAAEHAELLAVRRGELSVGRRENRPSEISQLVSKLADNRATLAAAKKSADETEAWNTYLACETVPSALDIRGINDYLSLWTDDHLAWDFSVDEALAKCEEANKLSLALDQMAGQQDDAKHHEQAVISRAKSTEVREMLLQKLDAISAAQGQYADRFTPDDMSDLLVAYKLSSLRMFVWGNLTNDPATIEVEFKTKEEGDAEMAIAAAAAAAAEEEGDKKKKKRGSKVDAVDADAEADSTPNVVYPKVSVSKGLTTANVAIRAVQLDTNPFTPDTRLVALSDLTEEDDFGGEEPEEEPVVEEEKEEGEEGEDGAAAAAEGDEAKAAEGDAAVPEGDAAAAAAATPAEGEAAAPAAEGDAAAGGAEGTAAAAECADGAAAAGADGAAPVEQDKASMLEEVVEEKVARVLRPGEVNLDKFMPVGSVLLLDLFELVEGPINARKWKMRVLSEHTETPVRAHYPLADAPRVPVPDKEGETMEARAGVAPWDAIDVQVFNFEGIVTDGVVDNENAVPILAWWDSSRKAWFSDGFDEISLNRATNMLKFTTKRLAPVTILQKRSRFTAVHDWEVQQSDTDPDCVTLSLVGNKHTTMLNFNNAGMVSIMEPKLPELDGVLGQWFEPRQFIQLMVRRGYNCFPALQQRDEDGDVMNPPSVNKTVYAAPLEEEVDPEIAAALAAAQESGDEDAIKKAEEDAAAAAAVKKEEAEKAKEPVIKDYNTEVQVYKQISLLCNTFCFRESVWNHRLPGQDFCLRVIEQDTDGVELDGAAWRVMYISGSKEAYEIHSNEFDEEFSPEPTQNLAVKMHSTLYHAVIAGGTENGQKRVKQMSAAMSATLLKVLCSVRPLHNSTALGSKAYQESERKRVAEEKAAAEAAAEAARIAAEEAEAARLVAEEAAAAEAAASPPPK